ncbi:MAG: RsmD family RNA methyltransferase [Minicystis sp.]
MPTPRPDRRRPARPARPAPPRGWTKTVTLSIDHLAPGGAGVGRLEDGMVVFVPHAAPGEQVEIELDRSRKPAQGRILRVLTPSPDRVEPPCPHVHVCGGCDWMHLAASAQERGHAAIVAGALARVFPDAALPAISVHAAPRPLGYRTRARLFARAEKGRASVGYRAEGSHELAAVDSCAVLDPALAPMLAEIPALLRGARGTGDVWIARGEGGRPVLELGFRGELPPSTWSTIDTNVRQGTWAGARVLLDGTSTPASFGDPRARMRGADGAPLTLSAGGFAQPSDEGGALLATRVDALARLHGSFEGREPLWKEAGPRHVVELFAGSGTLSVLLARGAASFTAVEIDPAASACAKQNLDERGLAAKVVTTGADAFVIPPRTEVVVLDPPRTGAAIAMSAIVASSARAVIYVACDPPTMARDLAILAAAGFVLTHLEIVELFPQTSHVEAVARLIRARPARHAGAKALP